jgi:hypothetical protein
LTSHKYNGDTYSKVDIVGGKSLPSIVDYDSTWVLGEVKVPDPSEWDSILGLEKLVESTENLYLRAANTASKKESF